MSDPRTAPYAAVRLVDVARLADVDPGNEDVTDGAFHLVRRHFDVQAFGVNGITGNTGDVMIIEHDERDDTEAGTEGHEELFAVMSGHAVFMIAGEEIEAPAGTLVFVRDPKLLRFARATADGTAILAVGARPGAPFAVSRWEQAVRTP
jgi:mannose-6-phosphate isomerase-like protein (cupin superfamily)